MRKIGPPHLNWGIALLVGFVSGLMAWPSDTEAGVEARCTALGVNCIMSEPLNTNSYAFNAASFYYNPADTGASDKEGNWAQSEYPIWSPDTTWSGATTGDEAYNALPAAARTNVTYIGRTGNDWVGSLYMGHNSNTSYNTKAAFRYYIYHSANFTLSGEGSCTNGKIFEMNGPYPTTVIIDRDTGPPNLRAFSGFTPTIDCCVSGPGNQSNLGQINSSYWHGKWVRVEVVMDNRSGGTFGVNEWRLHVYFKNITDGTPELEVINTKDYYTAVCNPICNGWDNTIAHNPAGMMQKFALNLHRGGTCTGYQAVTHMIMAGWDTDQGQRIGAASEIEGGGGSTTPPAAPTGLKVQ